MTARPPRLTDAEWDALNAAVEYAATFVDDARLAGDRVELARQQRRTAAANRALDKIREHMR
jgi:hypothetical protein